MTPPDADAELIAEALARAKRYSRMSIERDLITRLADRLAALTEAPALPMNWVTVPREIPSDIRVHIVRTIEVHITEWAPDSNPFDVAEEVYREIVGAAPSPPLPADGDAAFEALERLLTALSSLRVMGQEIARLDKGLSDAVTNGVLVLAGHTPAPPTAPAVIQESRRTADVAESSGAPGRNKQVAEDAQRFYTAAELNDLLRWRDDFLVSRGLFGEMVEWLSNPTAPELQRAGDGVRGEG